MVTPVARKEGTDEINETDNINDKTYENIITMFVPAGMQNISINARNK